MKKNVKMYLLAGVALLGLTFAACDKETEENNQQETPTQNGGNNNQPGGNTETGYAAKVAGTYAGKMTVSMLGLGDDADAEVVLNAAGANTVRVHIPQVSSNDRVPAFDVANVNVSLQGNIYSLDSTHFQTTVAGAGISGYLYGTVTGGKLWLKSQVNVTGLNMPVDLEFKM